MTRLRASLLLLTLVSLPRPALAQANQRMAPVGGRTTLVGGTGLLYGHDSASAFLNPATVTRVDKNRLSFSVDFYYLSLIKADAWYQPGVVDRERFGDVASQGNQAVSAFDFDSLPGSLCIFFGIGDLPFLEREKTKELQEKKARLGFCLASIQYNAFTFNAEDYEQQTPQGFTRQAQNFRQTFRRLAFGPTYAMHVDNRLTIGASIHATRSSHRSIIGATATTFASPGGSAAGSPINTMLYNVSRGDSHDLTATVGVTYRISPRQSVALALQSPSLHVFGSGGINHHSAFRGATTGAAEETYAADGTFVSRTAPRIAIGTGIETSDGSVEFNAAYHPPLAEAYVAELDGRAFAFAPDGTTLDQSRKQRYSVPALGVVNFGVGGEYFVSKRISLLGGLSTDASMVSKGALTTDPFNYYPARMHRLGASFGVGSHGDGGDLLIGLETSYGWGERVTPNVYQLPTRLDITDQKLFGFLFVLAGSTSFRSFKQAAIEVKKAVDPTSDEKKSTPEKK